MDDAAFRRRIGTVLSGKWRLDALLGTGGMASVFAATHVRNRLQTAVKLLHPEVSRDEKLRQRFLREGYVANSVKHPGVVQVFDDSGEELEAYLVMELLVGQTLKQRWNASGRKLPLEEVRGYISATLDTLVAAHAADIVHRDLKPDNIFLTTSGIVKVLDFGIARLREVQNAHEQATNTGVLLGTPAFMPPEQALGNWEEVDARADLFAVAATAWVLLTGQLVHQAKGVSELLIAAATRKARPIKSLVENLPDPVAFVIDKALSFEKVDRFPSAEVMKRAWDSAFIVRHAPTLRMAAPAAQAMLDWSVRAPAAAPYPTTPGAMPAATRASHPSFAERSHPLPTETASDVAMRGATPVFDPTAAPLPHASKAPSIPTPLFTTETPVSREHAARASHRKPLWIALALAAFAVAAVVVVVVTAGPSPAGRKETSAPAAPPPSSVESALSPSLVPSAILVPAPPPSAEPSVSIPTASAAPSVSASAAPSVKPPPRPPVTRPTSSIPSGCEDPMRDFANNGQPCPRRR
ncbi:MAG: protein kinase [Polyangiaceae bacterium]